MWLALTLECLENRFTEKEIIPSIYTVYKMQFQILSKGKVPSIKCQVKWEYFQMLEDERR